MLANLAMREYDNTGAGADGWLMNSTGAKKTRRKYRMTPLRQAQKDLTRSRIRDAARELFYEFHFVNTTMEQIAARAGLTRQSIYLHYKDKTDLLADIVADHTPRAEAQMATLPGPEPSLDELADWIDGLADFFEREQVSHAILMEATNSRIMQPQIDDLTQHVLTGLGSNNPAFRKAAAAKDGDFALRGRAVLLVNQLAFVGQISESETSRAWKEALQQALAESFHNFLSRFND